jgi:hypothetical protein
MFLNCGKQYGSEASLKNHRKIKHGVQLLRKTKPIIIRNSEDKIISF